jgi:hypothetical protein
MAITTWIDNLVKVWKSIEVKGGKMESYSMYRRKEFPDTINPQKLPVALTFVESVDVDYSAGGPNKNIYRGRTDFFINGSGVMKEAIPAIMPYFDRIVIAAAANFKLGGSIVDYFMLDNDRGDAIEGIVQLDWGDEKSYLGLSVRWVVKEDVGQTVTVSL